MVPASGLEPELTYVNKILSLACLPIPPRGLMNFSIGNGANLSQNF